MFQVFARSFKGLNLSPGERAAMKLVEGWLLTAVGAGAAIAYQQLTSGNVDYHLILPSAGGAALLTLLLSVKKYLAAQTDVPLPAPSLVTPAPVAPITPAPAPQPGTGLAFTTPVPQPPPQQFIPMPGISNTTTTVQPPIIPLNRDWSGLVTTIPTQQVPSMPTQGLQ